MISNRLVQVLKEKFKDRDIEKSCIESSFKKIVEKDCSRIFDQFPDLLDNHDPRIKTLSAELNSLYLQLYKNKYDSQLHISIKKNIRGWLTRLAVMGRHELLNSDGSIKYQLIKLLKWDHISHSIDTAQLLQAYVSMVLPQIMLYLKESNQFCPDNYGAIILDCSNKLAPDYIQSALYPKDEGILDLSILIPVSISALAGIGGLLAWSFFSDKESCSDDEMEFKHYQPPH